MSDERLRRIEDLYHAALAKPAEARAAFLAEACGEDDGLRREVMELVAQAVDDSFLERPAMLEPGNALQPGDQLGPYTIVAVIGAGGMGEVYRARDTKLNRDVALKVLPAVLAADRERLARFRREAQVLASLNHPNIAHLYGFEETALSTASGPGVTAHALVMELVEGPTLAARIAHGPIPLGEALAIATEIADALEAAHEQGIVHRDLKPANVKVREDGTVKVLDFGLAKALAPDSASALDAVDAPTMTGPATELGAILGTAAYMAPEQAKGQVADRRADLWAFGVVLFEMITGRRLFTGETSSEVMAAVMKEEPDWSRLPADLPASLLRLLRRCLEKNPKKRLNSMSDAKLELGEAEHAPADAPLRAAGRSRLWMAAWALGGAALTAAAFLFVMPTTQPAQVHEPTRLSVLAPEGFTLSPSSIGVQVSPNGRALVFTTIDATGASRLWVRRLAEIEAHLLPGTEGALQPFWSPDSRQIAFLADGKLKKIPEAGGAVQVICEAPDMRGGSWGSQNVIVFGSANSPLQRVSADGGDPQVVTTLDAARGETGHRSPWFLPDGRHFLFAALPQKNEKFDLFVGSIDTPTRQAVTSAGSAAVYAEPGYLLFTRRNVLVAQPFDAARLQLSGEPIPIGDEPGGRSATLGSWAVTVSSTGVLAYKTTTLANTRLVWLDRSGRELTGVTLPDGRYTDVSVAPDGLRAAVVRQASVSDWEIWIADIEHGGATRFASGPGTNNHHAAWSPDSNRLAFVNDREGPADVFIKPASGATPEQPLHTAMALLSTLDAWSPYGQYLVIGANGQKTANDIWFVPPDGHGKPESYLQTPFQDVGGTISPDGRWMAYLSNESGREECYVDAFPKPRNRRQVTTAGCGGVLWNRDGTKLAVVTADRRSVLLGDVIAGAEFKLGTPRATFAVPQNVVTYDLTSDFQRLLALVPASDTTKASLTVVLDWANAIRKK